MQSSIKRKTWILGISMLMLACSSPQAFSQNGEGVETSAFQVEGMTCAGCELGVEVSIEKLDGVEDAEASYREKRVVVIYDPDKVDSPAIIQAIEELGYQARRIEPDQESTVEGEVSS